MGKEWGSRMGELKAATFFIDGDFDSGKGDCKYHCSPTCHPAQVGPEWKHGCTHKAWPGNRVGDFVPIVECGGLIAKCDLKQTKLLVAYRRGLALRLKNSQRKAAELATLIAEVDVLK